MLNCKQMAELTTEYLEGELGFWQRVNYYLHWALCPPCRNYRDQVAQTARCARLAQQAEDREAEGRRAAAPGSGADGEAGTGSESQGAGSRAPGTSGPPAELLERFHQHCGED